MNKTGIEWAEEFGVQILDPDGFGERIEDRPHMNDLMDIAMFNKCMAQSSVEVKDENKWRNRLVIGRTYRER